MSRGLSTGHVTLVLAGFVALAHPILVTNKHLPPVVETFAGCFDTFIAERPIFQSVVQATTASASADIPERFSGDQ